MFPPYHDVAVVVKVTRLISKVLSTEQACRRVGDLHDHTEELTTR
jgi:hypothetical protein